VALTRVVGCGLVALGVTVLVHPGLLDSITPMAANAPAMRMH